jgi:hypothetical protein
MQYHGEVGKREPTSGLEPLTSPLYELAVIGSAQYRHVRKSP